MHLHTHAQNKTDKHVSENVFSNTTYKKKIEKKSKGQVYTTTGE